MFTTFPRFLIAFGVVVALCALFLLAMEREGAKENQMTEPSTTVAGGIAGYKLALLTLPLVAAIVGFWLGLRFVPLRRGHELGDVTTRMTACVVSSFGAGIPVLLALMHYAPETFEAATRLALLAGVAPVVGFLVLVGCVMVLCSIPGPWVIAAVFLWLERRKGKDIAELVGEVRGNQASNEASTQVQKEA